MTEFTIKDLRRLESVNGWACQREAKTGHMLMVSKRELMNEALKHVAKNCWIGFAGSRPDTRINQQSKAVSVQAASATISTNAMVVSECLMSSGMRSTRATAYGSSLSTQTTPMTPHTAIIPTHV